MCRFLGNSVFFYIYRNLVCLTNPRPSGRQKSRQPQSTPPSHKPVTFLPKYRFLPMGDTLPRIIKSLSGARPSERSVRIQLIYNRAKIGSLNHHFIAIYWEFLTTFTVKDYRRTINGRCSGNNHLKKKKKKKSISQETRLHIR